MTASRPQREPGPPPGPSHGMRDGSPRAYDAILYLSFGGPEGPEEVMPFIENVTRGRGIPRHRLEEVAEHYHLFGGVSPINAQNRAVIAALEVELARNALDLPVYWGNRNWHPFVTDAVMQMRNDGVGRAAAFVTSAYSSYSACRQYREDIGRARAEVGRGAPKIDKLRLFYNHPGFIEPQAATVRSAIATVAPERRASASIAFTAHSIPESMAGTSSYVAQLEEACRLVAERAGGPAQWKLVYQSRSGPPAVPWLGPDVAEHLRWLHREGATDVVICPIGFVSDHLEVRFDLDVEAATVAAELGLNMVRAATVGADPAYVRMIAELVLERMDPRRPRLAAGNFAASHDCCAADCCPAPAARPGS